MSQMKIVCVALGLISAGGGMALARQSQEIPPAVAEKADRLRQDLREMIGLARDRVFPALVNISVITARYAGGKEQKGRATGSGTIISSEGYVLTNYHVAENGKKFKVLLADKQEVGATLVGEDPLTDLAVLKINLDELKDKKLPTPAAIFGDSDQVEIGDTVMAMGSPLALSRSVTLGIVSNTERILSGNDDEMEDMSFDGTQRTGLFNRWIQHDAAINPGNSGGPLVNLKGEVIGVNARGMMFGGDMGFAIPSNVARDVAEKLIKLHEVPRSDYGLSFKSIKKAGFKQGVLVNSVEQGGPADKAGLKAGDVITAIDGKPVTVIFAEEIPPLLRDLSDRAIGSTVKFSYIRDGKPADASVTTKKLEKDSGAEAAFRAWGMTAEDITPLMAREMRLDSADGLIVISIRGGSPAQLAEPPLAYGDVIHKVDGKPVATLKEFAARYESRAAEKGPEFVLIEFNRSGKDLVTVLKRPDKDEDRTPELPKAWIGVATQPVIEKLAKQLGISGTTGFRITRVYPGTQAFDAGLKIGDIVLSINGDKLRPKGMEDVGSFQRAVRALEIDDTARLKVLRDGQAVDVSVRLERSRLAPEDAARDRDRDFEMSVREITFFDRDDNRWDDSTRGVIVIDVESAGWAGIGGLRPGDLIQRIDESVIDDLKSYRAAMENARKTKPDRMVFVVLRGVRTHFQYVEPEWKVEVKETPAEAAGEKKEATP